MLVILEGKVISRKLLQHEKAPSPMLVIPEGRVISCKFLH